MRDITNQPDFRQAWERPYLIPRTDGCTSEEQYVTIPPWQSRSYEHVSLMQSKQLF